MSSLASKCVFVSKTIGVPADLHLLLRLFCLCGESETLIEHLDHRVTHRGTILRWYCNIMVLKHCGTIVPWYYNIMVLYYHGTIEPWYCKALVHGTVVPWYYGNALGPWCYSTVVL